MIPLPSTSSLSPRRPLWPIQPVTPPVQDILRVDSLRANNTVALGHRDPSLPRNTHPAPPSSMLAVPAHFLLNKPSLNASKPRQIPRKDKVQGPVPRHPGRSLPTHPKVAAVTVSRRPKCGVPSSPLSRCAVSARELRVEVGANVKLSDEGRETHNVLPGTSYQHLGLAMQTTRMPVTHGMSARTPKSAPKEISPSFQSRMKASETRLYPHIQLDEIPYDELVKLYGDGSFTTFASARALPKWVLSSPPTAGRQT